MIDLIIKDDVCLEIEYGGVFHDDHYAFTMSRNGHHARMYVNYDDFMTAMTDREQFQRVISELYEMLCEEENKYKRRTE